MNKKMNLIFAFSLLLISLPTQSITNTTAAIATVLIAPAYFFASDEIIDIASSDTSFEGRTRLKAAMSVTGTTALAAATRWALNEFTPSGRYKRAEKIVEKLKGKYSRVFGDPSKTTQAQVFNELSGFYKSHQDARNFAHFNVLKTLDGIDCDLKKAESLLVAAKRDNGPEVIETFCYAAKKCKKGAVDLFNNAHGYFKNGTVQESDQIIDPRNHIEFEAQIDSLLAEVRTMQNKVAHIYGDIELSHAFKQQLKEYQELRAHRSQNNRSDFINGAIITATVTAPVAVMLAASSFAILKMTLAKHVSKGKLSSNLLKDVGY